MGGVLCRVWKMHLHLAMMAGLDGGAFRLRPDGLQDVGDVFLSVVEQVAGQANVRAEDEF